MNDVYLDEGVKMTNRITLNLLGCLLLLASFSGYSQPPIYTLQTGIGSDDVIEDSFFHVTGSVLFSQGISRNSIVDYIAEISTINYQDEDDNSAEKLFLQVEYSYTPRAGFRVPTYSVALRQQEEYKDDSDFDSSTTSLLFSTSYRIDDRSHILGGIRVSEESSDDDTSETGFFVNFDYIVKNDLLLYVTLNVANEETDLGSRPESPFSNRKHLPGEPGFVGPDTTSGKIGSDNTFLTAGASYVLGSNSSIDAAIQQQTYDTDTGEISGSVVTFDYFYRF